MFVHIRQNRCPSPCLTWSALYRASAQLALLGCGVLWATLGHTEWREYPDKHISLITNIEPARAAKLLQHLGWFRQVADAYIEAPVHDHLPPVQLVVFASRKTFNKVVNQRHFAAYTQPDIARTTLVVGPEDNGDVIESSLHEYVHYRLRTQAIGYPRWYEEGLAVLLSAAEFTVEDGQVTATIGRRLPAKLQYNALALPKPASLLTTADQEDWPLARLASYYKQSAYLLRYLLHAELPQNKQQALQIYLEQRDIDLLSKLEMDASALSRALKEFRQNPRRARQLKIQSASNEALRPPASQPLTRTSQLTLLANLAESPNPGFAITTYRKLAKRNPTEVRYWAWLARTQMARNERAAARSLERAADLDPGHPDVLIQQTRLKLRQCPLDETLTCLPTWRSASAPLRQALDRNPEHFQGILWLGVTELYSGYAGRALNYLRIAHQRAPWSPMVNFHLGECLRLLGNPRGYNHLQRAMWWAQDAELQNAARLALQTWRDTQPAAATGTDNGANEHSLE